MTEKNPKIIAMNGGKKHDLPTLKIDDETIVLDSFVLSGVNSEGKHCLMTFNCSLEALTSYSMILDTMVRDKIRENMP